MKKKLKLLSLVHVNNKIIICLIKIKCEFYNKTNNNETHTVVLLQGNSIDIPI